MEGNKRAGILSFRLAGTDGVSLEAFKWAAVLGRLGYESWYFGGELQTPPERSFRCPLAHFRHPAVEALTAACFGCDVRGARITERIHHLRATLKRSVHDFLRRSRVELLIVENVLTIPLNVPLALAVTEAIAETGIPTIAHHHDFHWERKRFVRTCIGDFLRSACPPSLPSIQHVVINSAGREQLALRTGDTATLIPNVMDFAAEAPPIDAYNAGVRASLGLGADEALILQPTRVLQRKGIEHAIELVRRLDLPAKLVISHAAGDEGREYEVRIREYARLLGVNALFVSDIIDVRRGATDDGRRVYALADVYPHADLVTYPSLFEGFGNAFLEAIYFRKPLVVNRYSVYTHDIEPLGFRTIEMDEFVSDDTVREARRYLSDPALRAAAAEHNYRIARTYYSFETLEERLRLVLSMF